MTIAITMGDPSGIGPEIILKAHKNKRITGSYFVIGDYEILEYCNTKLRYGVKLKRINSIEEINNNYLNIYNLDLLKKQEIEVGKATKKGGYASYKYIEFATKLALERKIEAFVTLPINKEAVRMSFNNYSGHTEQIAEMCKEKNTCMMLISEKLIVTHVTTHVSLVDAIKQITEERVYNVVKLTNEALNKFKKNPKIAVAGLNPHAGENCLFGYEERDKIKPAIQKAKMENIHVCGPISPDIVFLKAYNKKYDAVVCMYHDQGHIPMKLLDFERCANVTLGLKIIRVSVDHGTAYDIAYKGISSIESFCFAYEFAVKLISS